MKTYRGAELQLHHYDLGIRCRTVVSLTLLLLYLQRNSHRYPLDRRLDRLQSQSGRDGEETNLASAENQTPVVQSVAHRSTDYAIIMWASNM
jgi:hypothetical protein